MSKTKSKGSKDVAPSAGDVLNKVKDAAITKPAQTVKAKSKELAKQVVGKEEKKSKSKKVKEPSPESSDDDSEVESDESGGSSDSEEESESEVETKKPVKNGKVNGAAKVVKKDESESEDESAESDSSEDEAPAKRVKAPAAKKAEAESSDEEDDEDSDEEESDEEEAAPKNKGPVKAAELSKKLKPVAKDSSDEDDSEAESVDDDADSSEADSSSEDEEEEVEAKPAKKRKAEEDETPAAKKTKTAEVDAGQGGNLFVGNLSWNVDEEWLKTEFEAFGELTGVRIITDRDTGRSKGFGYVEFADAADAAKAHSAMKDHLLDNRALNVDFASSKPAGNQQDRAQSRAKSYGDQASQPSDTLFVGNLSFDVGQETVSEAFGEYGTILGVRLPTDRDTGEPKGFGYVTFSSVDEAKGALEAMQGYEISGRACRLDYSQPRPQNGESPGRGGRGGRGGFDRGGRGGGRGGFDRGGRGGGRGFGGRGRGGFDRGGRGGGRGASTNRGGFGDFSGKKVTF